MRGKVCLLAVAVSMVLGCGTITVAESPDGGARLDAGPGPPPPKKNPADDQGDQADKGPGKNKPGQAS
jgi:hypothetical protein